MAAARVLSIRTGGERHPDYQLLTALSLWMQARAEARLHWATQAARTVFHTVPGPSSGPSQALRTIRDLQATFAEWVPETTLGAQQLLLAAIDILQRREIDPEETLAGGPVIPMLAAAARALGRDDLLLK